MPRDVHSETPSTARDGGCLVVGGGVMGLMVAAELARSGARVTLLEKATTGRGASWAGGGILSPLHPWRSSPGIAALHRESQRAYENLSRELSDCTGIDPQWTATGMMVLDETEPESVNRWARESGHAAHWLTPDVFGHRMPGAAAAKSGAFWLPGIAQVRNPRLVRALRVDLERAGVSVVENTEVQRIEIRGGRVTGVHAGNRRFQSDTVVLTAGAWTGNLLPGGFSPLEIRPVRGQMLLYRADPGTLPCILLRGDRYLIPRRDGRILAGSTVEDAGFDVSTTAAARDDLHREATDLLPSLRDCTIERHWAGLRPRAGREDPVIAAHPEVSGLVVCSGHYRCGLALAPASARLAADLVLGRQPGIDPAPYRWPRSGSQAGSDVPARSASAAPA